ncbi:MAG: DNA-processing protein DprA [Lachnospiraceae bacterium]|nr:DNA-processing protein DprA [Lachnospiraceae bacterium]
MKYNYWLWNVKGFGDQRCHHCIETFKSAKQLYEASFLELQKVPGLKEKEIQSLLDSKKSWNLEQEWERLLESGCTFLTRNDPGYPNRLLNIDPVPFALYSKGNLPQQDQFQVAIVGARMCTGYGEQVAQQLGKEFAKMGIGVISGLARGVDTASLWGAIRENGASYGVLGGGVNYVYPPENKKIYHQILENGGLLSQYHPNQQPQAQFFSYRNRIISGLADAVIVIEAKEKSGSLITADFALSQGKEVYAIPGRMNDPVSQGCNQLIHQGAQIVVSIESLFEDMKLFNRKFYEKSVKNKIRLEKEELLVYSCLGLHPKSFSQVMEEVQLPIGQLMKIINELVDQELIVEYYKNYYCRSEV